MKATKHSHSCTEISTCKKNTKTAHDSNKTNSLFSPYMYITIMDFYFSLPGQGALLFYIVLSKRLKDYGNRTATLLSNANEKHEAVSGVVIYF